MKYLQIIIRVFIILVVFLLNAVNVFGEVSSVFKPGNEDRILILNCIQWLFSMEQRLYYPYL